MKTQIENLYTKALRTLRLHIRTEGDFIYNNLSVRLIVCDRNYTHSTVERISYETGPIGPTVPCEARRIN
jgi:hypothetical protein